MSRVSGAVELVRLMLLRGQLAPGERIVEVHVAERLRVGRATLREALRRLEGEGLLVAGDSGGMRVVRLDQRQVAATVQVRAALEALSAGLAAGHVRDGVPAAALAALRDLALAADASARSDPPETAVLADRHFHRAVVTLSANQPCRDALNPIWDRIVIATAYGVVGAVRAPSAAPEHREAFEAIAAGDAEEASALARRHVLTGLR